MYKDEAGRAALLAYAGVGHHAGGRDGMEGGHGSRVMDHPEEAVGQSDPLAEPGQDNGFEFDRGRAGEPDHAVDVESGGEHFAEDAGGRRADGEVSVEMRVVPMGHGRHDLALEIGQDCLHGLALLGRGSGERGGQITGLNAWKDGVVARVFEIVGDPVNDLVAVAAESSGTCRRVSFDLQEDGSALT